MQVWDNQKANLPIKLSIHNNLEMTLHSSHCSLKKYWLNVNNEIQEVLVHLNIIPPSPLVEEAKQEVMEEEIIVNQIVISCRSFIYVKRMARDRRRKIGGSIRNEEMEVESQADVVEQLNFEEAGATMPPPRVMISLC